jgi:hypothetical protein
MDGLEAKGTADCSKQHTLLSISRVALSHAEQYEIIHRDHLRLPELGGTQPAAGPAKPHGYLPRARFTMDTQVHATMVASTSGVRRSLVDAQCQRSVGLGTRSFHSALQVDRAQRVVD